MDLVQADFVGNARVYSDESSNREFERIFGFPPQLIRDAVRMALRSYMESDDIHTQLSGPRLKSVSHVSGAGARCVG